MARLCASARTSSIPGIDDFRQCWAERASVFPTGIFSLVGKLLRFGGIKNQCCGNTWAKNCDFLWPITPKFAQTCDRGGWGWWWSRNKKYFPSDIVRDWYRQFGKMPHHSGRRSLPSGHTSKFIFYIFFLPSKTQLPLCHLHTKTRWASEFFFCAALSHKSLWCPSKTNLKIL